MSSPTISVFNNSAGPIFIYDSSPSASPLPIDVNNISDFNMSPNTVFPLIIQSSGNIKTTLDVSSNKYSDLLSSMVLVVNDSTIVLIEIL